MRLASAQGNHKHAVKHICTSPRGIGPLQAFVSTQAHQWRQLVSRFCTGWVQALLGRGGHSSRWGGLERQVEFGWGQYTASKAPAPATPIWATADLLLQFYRHGSEQSFWAACGLQQDKGTVFPLPHAKLLVPPNLVRMQSKPVGLPAPKIAL